MAVAQLTSTSALAFKSAPSFEGLRSAKGFSKANVSLLYPSFATRSFHGLITCATSVSSAKYTSIKPLGDRVLIKIKTVEEKTSSGIFLPLSSQKKQQSGEVVAVGAGKRVGDSRVPIAVETGKEVVYSKYVGTEVEVDGSSHLILKEDDIIGILESDDVKDLKPLNDRVLIKVAEAEGKTSGGLLLSESAKERPSFGTVVAAGPGLLDEDGTRKPLPVSPGNTVLYSKYAGNDLKPLPLSPNDISMVKDLFEVGLNVDKIARKQVIDPVLHKECPDNSLKILMDLCVRSVSSDANERPSIEDVLWNLQFAAQIQDSLQGDVHSDRSSPVFTSR